MLHAFPNLIVIGAMKCGTTALHRYLGAHPDISMAGPKELNFFIGSADADGRGDWHAGNWHRGLDWYAGHFDPRRAVRGEASPGYTSPARPEAAARMAAVVPQARLVYLVRDPVDRALSQYRHHRAEGSERRPVEVALLDPRSQYLARSRYYERLVPYLERFPRERIAVVLQEDLLANPTRTLAGLFRFAGVDDAVRPRVAERTSQVGTSERPAVDGALEARLVAAVADDVARLRALTGRDLAEWRSY